MVPGEQEGPLSKLTPRSTCGLGKKNLSWEFCLVILKDKVFFLVGQSTWKKSTFYSPCLLVTLLV